jgi:hypothetical protein
MAPTFNPYERKILPIDAEVIPLPIELTTPPVIIIYFVRTSSPVVLNLNIK